MYMMQPPTPSPSPFSIVREYLYNKTPNPINIILKQKIIINWGVCINCQLICHRIKKCSTNHNQANWFPYKLLIPEVGRGEKILRKNIATAKVPFSRNHMYDVLH